MVRIRGADNRHYCYSVQQCANGACAYAIFAALQRHTWANRYSAIRRPNTSYSPMIAAIRVDNTMGVLSFLQTAALKHSGAAVGAYSSLTSSDTGFAKTLVHTFVMSRVDHCNAVLARYITTYNLLNSSNKRACSNTFVHVTLVSSTHNNGQKLKENVKSDTRKLLKRLEKTI